jgi:anthranilate phosphoribosyltransferase
VNEFANILQARKQLSFNESYRMQDAILSGKLGTYELIQVFTLMEERYPNIEEMNGIIAATRESMVKVPINSDSLDIVGTGCDGLKTFNVSTAASIVCAACGIPVVKHGNRSATSRCGSADVLEALGVNIMLDSEHSVSCYHKTGMVFLFAPMFHPSLKNAAQARRQFGKRTYFNILGPLVNPGSVSHQTLGVFDSKLTALMGETSVNNGTKQVWIVRSKDGMDELSPLSLPEVKSFSAKAPIGETMEVVYDLSKGSLNEMQVNNVQESAEIIISIFKNEATPMQKQAVLINAAAGIMTFGKVHDFSEAMGLADDAIKSGRAMEKLNQLIFVSNG